MRLEELVSVLLVSLHDVPLLAVRVELVDLVLVVDHVHALAVLQDVVLELYELLALPHHAVLRHPPDLEGPRVDCEALVRQVSIKETSEYHNLRVAHSKAAQLAALGITARPLEEYQLPMGRSVEVVRGCEIETLYSAQ